MWGEWGQDGDWEYQDHADIIYSVYTLLKTEVFSQAEVEPTKEIHLNIHLTFWPLEQWKLENVSEQMYIVVLEKAPSKGS